MSYTAPQYVDTKEQAVLALASTIAGEDKTALGDGSVNTALDVLADVLAGQDVEVPQTNAGAILALAQYVQGGGGSSTQTLTVTKSAESDTVSVHTLSWADYIADNWDASVDVQPDSTEGLVSVYSIPVGAYFEEMVSSGPFNTYFDAEHSIEYGGYTMPSTPLYASILK
jgi:hypothetical protein